MKAFFHIKDLDGKCSGAIIKRKYPEIELIGVDYDDSYWIPEMILDYEEVYFLDFSLSVDGMMSLNNRCNLTWIDHHEGIIKAINSRSNIDGKTIAGRRAVGQAACELAWKHFFSDDVPLAVYLLGRYDVYDLTAHPDVLSFQYGLRSADTNPINDMLIWNQLFDSPVGVPYFCEKGRHILDYVEATNKFIMETSAFPVDFGGIRFLAVNSCSGNSSLFEEAFSKGLCEAGIVFSSKGPNWKVSMFCKDETVPILDLAIKCGGGGHRKACGFVAQHLPWIP